MIFTNTLNKKKVSDQNLVGRNQAEIFKKLSVWISTKIQKQWHLSPFLAFDGNSVACAKIALFQFENCSTDRKVSIDTLMEEVNSKVIEKYAHP